MTGARSTGAGFGALSTRMLDLIRVFAALSVVVGHDVSFFFPELGLRPPKAVYLENLSVVLFFIVSGYLIAHQLDLFARRRLGFGDFFWNRFARIYVGLIPALIVILAIDLARLAANLPYAHGPALNVWTFIGNVLMLENFPLWPSAWPAVVPFGSGRPLWTLAIEWWIYLFVGWGFFRWEALAAWRLQAWVVWGLLATVPLWNLVYGTGNALFLFWLAGGLTYVLVSRLPLPGAMPGVLVLGSVVMLSAAVVRLWLACPPSAPMRQNVGIY